MNEKTDFYKEIIKWIKECELDKTHNVYVMIPKQAKEQK